METVEQLKEEIPQLKLGDSNVLFLDVSSSCTGFAIHKINFIDKSSKLLKAGCIWLDENWEHAKKYDYIYNAIQTYFDIVEQIDYIVVEQYSVNTSKMSGVLVSPEVHGVIKAAAFSNGVRVGSILPQTWRAQLGIKPDITVVKVKGKDKNKREYKKPTKLKVLETVAVPEKVISNITRKERQTPSDVYDAIALGAGWLKKFGIKTIDTSDCQFNAHIGEGAL